MDLVHVADEVFHGSGLLLEWQAEGPHRLGVLMPGTALAEAQLAVDRLLARLWEIDHAAAAAITIDLKALGEVQP
jgi:hypothetical protein